MVRWKWLKLARPATVIGIAAMGSLHAAMVGPINTYGFGSATCAQFGEAYKKTPGLTEDMFFAWAQGYLTGINTARQALHEKLIDLAPAALGMSEEKAFIRDTCESNPLKHYVTVVGILAGRLAQIQGLK